MTVLVIRVELFVNFEIKLILKKQGLLLCFFCLTTALSGQKISNKKIARQIDKISAFQGAHIGIKVSAVSSSKSRAEYNAHDYFTPASNVKIITFLAALQTFDALPALHYFKTPSGTLHFTATGYPLLLHPKYPDQELFSFLKQQKSLVYHLPQESPTRLGAGWSWDDQQYYFSAQKSAFPIYGNVVQFYQDTLSKNFVAKPSRFLTHFLPQKKEGLPLKEFSYKFDFNPKKLTPQDTLLKPFSTTPKQFVDLLSEATQSKVEIDSLPFPKNQIQRVLYTHQEEKLYKALLQDSDNLIAESLLLMIGKAKNDTLNTKKTIDYLQSRWQDDFSDPLIWADGSGVSRYNLLTPSVIVEALQKTYSILGWEKITTLFPAGGISGTILNYYKDASSPYVFAKTGTLKNNISLSGFFIGKNNRIYVFSILVNNHTSSNEAVREGIATLIQFFRKKY